MKKWLLLFALLFPAPALASSDYVVVTTCGTISPTWNAGAWGAGLNAGLNGPVTVDVNGVTCTSSGGGGGGSVTQGTTPGIVAATGITPVVSASAESDHIISATPKSLYGFSVVTSLTSEWYVLVFDSATAPVDGAVTPKKCYDVPAGVKTLGVSFGLVPDVFATGIVVSVSTTGCFTKTASATGFISGEAK